MTKQYFILNVSDLNGKVLIETIIVSKKIPKDILLKYAERSGITELELGESYTTDISATGLKKDIYSEPVKIKIIVTVQQIMHL